MAYAWTYRGRTRSAGDMVEDAVLVLLGIAMLPAAALMAAIAAIRGRI